MTAAFNLSQFANKVNTSGKADLTTAVTGTLPIANGGTGLTSAGASGNVLQSNGSAWTSATIAIFAGDTGQAFTTVGTNQTFTIPSGITKLKVTVVAGGGAGGNATNPAAVAGGGGGGGAAIKYLTGLNPGYTLAVTVGAAGGASSVATGVTGTPQTISTISATAGTAGTIGNSYKANGVTGGVGSGGDLNIYGGVGGAGLNIRTSTDTIICVGGQGGSSILGGGGYSVISDGTYSPTTTNGVAGLAYGSGGSGASRAGGGAGTSTGGSGASGCVIIEW